jgi:hypothetical protein
MTAEDERFDAFCRALVQRSWSTPQYSQALDGFFVREHAQEHHAESLPLVEELGLKRISDPDHQDAWLFGYRFRDTSPPQGGAAG